MLVQVTKAHIDQGIRGEPSRCPISLAIIDLGYEVARTGWTRCSMKKTRTSDETFRYYLPPEAQSFVHAFDHRHEVKPIRFVIERIV